MEPGALAFGVLAGCDYDALFADREFDLAGQVAANFANPDGFGGGGSQIREVCHLFHRSLPEHVPGAETDALFEGGGFPGKNEAAKVGAFAVERAPLLGNRPSAKETDLEGPLEVAGVLGVDARGFQRIELFEAPIEFREGKRLQFATEVRVGGRERGRAVAEELEVEPRTTHHDRQFPASRDFR